MAIVYKDVRGFQHTLIIACAEQLVSICRRLEIKGNKIIDTYDA